MPSTWGLNVPWWRPAADACFPSDSPLDWRQSAAPWIWEWWTGAGPPPPAWMSRRWRYGRCTLTAEDKRPCMHVKAYKWMGAHGHARVELKERSRCWPVQRGLPHSNADTVHSGERHCGPRTWSDVPAWSPSWLVFLHFAKGLQSGKGNQAYYQLFKPFTKHEFTF